MTATLATKGKEGRWKTQIIRFFTLVEVAEAVGVHRETLAKYQKIAKLYLKDYREMYSPRAPLDPYQAWCLDQIAQIMRRCQSYKTLQRHLFQNRHKYSLATFRSIQDGNISIG